MPKVKIFDDNYSVDVELDYDYITDNDWTCLPGYLKSDEGNWTSSMLHQNIKLLDEDGIEVAALLQVPVKVSTGDPLGDLAGKGPGKCLVSTKGGVMSGEVWWQFYK
jgi:hypothetical protein